MLKTLLSVPLLPSLRHTTTKPLAPRDATTPFDWPPVV